MGSGVGRVSVLGWAVESLEKKISARSQPETLKTVTINIYRVKFEINSEIKREIENLLEII